MLKKKPRSATDRRTVLKSFSLAAFSIVAAPALAGNKSIAANGSLSYKVYETISQMKRDQFLKSNELVRILGYFSVNDGGGAEYIIVKSSDYDLKGEEVIPINKELSAVLIGVASVNYKMFGAIGDGKNNDALQIRKAHEYANKKNIPVVNLSGEFWLREIEKIVVLTNVNWGNTIFHIDEKFNSKSSNRFEVKSAKLPVVISFSPAQKKNFLAALKKGVQNIPELSPYKNCLIVIADKKDNIGARAGSMYNGQSWAKEELFYVEEHGRIIGDIAWEFNDYTRLMAYPAEVGYLTIEGGTFYLSGDSPGINYEGYKKNGFYISRSRTIIRNQWVGLEPGKADVALDPRGGFYTFSTAYDVTLENVRLMPYEKDREGSAQDLPAGTYGIGMGRVLNSLFRNVTAEGGPLHWGVFGTNLNKNFRIENCQLNRVDVHFHCWNLYIKDSRIGYRGISVTGGGDLFIENTSCSARSFINFRRDFGSKWDGDIRLKNCRFIAPGSGIMYVLDFNPMDFDYKYPIGFGRSILVENLIVDFNGAQNKDGVCWLMRVPSFSKMKHGERLFFPEHLEFKNVFIKGREQGVRLIEIADPRSYLMEKPGDYDSINVSTNANIIFENILLENLEEKDIEASHFSLRNEKDADYEDELALFPSIKFSNCKNLTVKNTHNVSDLSFDYCSVAGFAGREDKPLKGRLIFNNCTFNPVIKDNNKNVYYLSSELGTSFTNCLVNAPMVKGESKPELFDKIDFIRINKSVKFNHLNTLLGRDILNHYKTEGLSFLPEFIQMLKNHHEMESDIL